MFAVLAEYHLERVYIYTTGMNHVSLLSAGSKRYVSRDDGVNFNKHTTVSV